ncbi:hypothetical protein ACOUVM_04310 [Acinetobacter baumannii]
MAIITEEKMQNLDTDIQHAGEAINEKKVIIPRYGDPFYSLPLAVQKVMETGGFEPFLTEAQLLASTPTISPKAAKALDTGKIWYWGKSEGTTIDAWHDTGLSELDQANKYAEKLVQGEFQKINLNLLSKAGTNILNVNDANDQYVMFIDQFSRMFLYGVDRPVQDYLADVEGLAEKVKPVDFNKNLLEFRDDKDNIYASFNHLSKLFLLGLSNSVQDTLNSDNLSPATNPFVHDSKSIVSDVVHKYLLTCLSGGGVIAPIPFSLAPHDYTPPPELINAKVQQGARLVIDTVYQKDDGVVHPHILEFRNGFLGYRYILGLTPYYNNQDKYENPCIYGSHDLQNFVLIDKFPQPFSERPAEEVPEQKVYNSDDFFTYDYYSGELLFCWRRNYEVKNPRVEVWARRTKNGLQWSSEEKIYDSRSLAGMLLSPSIIFNFSTKLYEMYVVERIDGSVRIRKLTTPTLKSPRWTDVKYFNPIPNANVWHLDVRYVGNKIYALAHDDIMTAPNSSKNLYLGVYDESIDDFTWSDPVLTGEHYDPYKATFTPLLDLENNTISLQIMWSSRSGGAANMWKLYSSKSNSFDLN